VKVKSAA